MGRNDAQATCLALKIENDGTVTLANAGHMAPYLNGEAIEMEGALPLGMMENAEFSVMSFQLNPDDKLVLMSDGIAEATNVEGHLFGFERIPRIARSRDERRRGWQIPRNPSGRMTILASFRSLALP